MSFYEWLTMLLAILSLIAQVIDVLQKRENKS